MTILLHGALGSSAQFDPLLAQAPQHPHVFALDFPGHKMRPASEPFSLPLFAASILDFMQERNEAQTDIFGYSMGGYVALWLAWQHPEKVRRIVTYGTKLDWNPEVAAGMVRMFDPEKIEAKAPALAESLAKTHGKDQWKNLCHRTADFLRDLGDGHGLTREAFGEIRCPVTIGWGDLDNVVSLEESKRVSEWLPQGQLAVIPGGKHLIEQVDAAQLAAFAFSP